MFYDYDRGTRLTRRFLFGHESGNVPAQRRYGFQDCHDGAWKETDEKCQQEARGAEVMVCLKE